MPFRWCHFAVLGIYNHGSCSIYHYFQPLYTLMKLKSVVVFFKTLVVNQDEVKKKNLFEIDQFVYFGMFNAFYLAKASSNAQMGGRA